MLAARRRPRATHRARGAPRVDPPLRDCAPCTCTPRLGRLLATRTCIIECMVCHAQVVPSLPWGRSQKVDDTHTTMVYIDAATHSIRSREFETHPHRETVRDRRVVSGTLPLGCDPKVSIPIHAECLSGKLERRYHGDAKRRPVLHCLYGLSSCASE